VTDPPFYKRCQKEDTPDYMYSIPGFDPCYPLDFSQIQDIKFLIECRNFLPTPNANLNPDTENLGYPYLDILTPAPQPSPSDFGYLSTNPRTGLKLISPTATLLVGLTLFDWKWLSHFQTLTVNVTDPNQLAGLVNVTMPINFTKLEESDGKGDSLFVAGGRVYFETEVYSMEVDSIIGKGFFDKAGYVEPPPQGRSRTGLVLGITIPIGVVLIGAGIYVYIRRRNK
jgi:hypothetical protein